ncbi:MAG: WbqC family protein [Phycisphaerae bacterium]
MADGAHQDQRPLRRTAHLRRRNRQSTPWRRKHWQTLQQAYGQAEHFREHAAFFADAYARDWTSLTRFVNT